MATPKGAEEVRKKWDALLSVINNISVDADGAGATSQESVQAARELLQNSGSLKASRSSPLRQKKSSEWDSRHHLLYSTVNHKMQKNVRAYFDRPRDIEGYGLKHRQGLRTVWQLDTPVQMPKAGQGHPNSVGKVWQTGGSCAGGGARLAATQITEGSGLTVGGAAEKRFGVLADVAGAMQELGDSTGMPPPQSKGLMKAPSTNYEDYEPHIDGGGWFLHRRSGKWKYHPEIGVFQHVQSGDYYVNNGGVMQKVEENVGAGASSGGLSKSTSAPMLLKELDWENRHHTMFNKDNHHYHPNFREYFERPRRLLY